MKKLGKFIVIMKTNTVDNYLDGFIDDFPTFTICHLFAKEFEIEEAQDSMKKAKKHYNNQRFIIEKL